MIPIPSLTAIKAGLAVVVIAGAFYAGWMVNGWRLERAIEAQKAEAAQTLADETARVRNEERAAAAETLDLEKQHAQAQASIDASLTLNSQHIDDLGGLRFAGSREGGSSAVSSAAGAAAGASGGASDCQLSRSVSRDLIELEADADRALERARLAKQYADEMTAWIAAQVAQSGEKK